MDTQSILSNIVVASLIGGLAMTIGRHGRRAAIAHILWIVFFVKLITPPIWQISLSVPHPLKMSWNSSWPNSIWIWVLTIWFVGFSVLLVRGVIASTRFALLLKREGQLDQEATEFVKSLLDKNRSAPSVVRLPVRLSPMLFGSLISPKIVCPDELWGLLTNEQRHAFLAHETAHYFRRDHWVRWLEWIVTAVYWWFPGVYFGRGQLERHEEACCDAWAVNRLGTTPRAYAETLLSVVDFVSEHEARIPRLANGMQPTYTLEERLRLLMRPPTGSRPSNSIDYSALTVCAGLWLLHPTLDFSLQNEAVSLATAKLEVLGPVERFESRLESAEPYQWPSDHLLPQVPRGFWNTKAEGKWADFTLQLNNARVIAEAGKGIAIRPNDGEPLHFSTDELVAMAEIPSTGRVVIGDAQGRLRLWDIQAGAAVSLIGQHNAAITSVTYHHKVGLLSADTIGNIVRWDLDSGLMLARKSLGANIQAIRCSSDGRGLAVLTGSWHDSTAVTAVSMLQCKTLEHLGKFVQPHSAATLIEIEVPTSSLRVSQHSNQQWFTIDWQGQLRPLQDPNSLLGLVDKAIVSSLVFAQQNITLQQIAPPPAPIINSTEPKEFIYVEQ